MNILTFSIRNSKLNHLADFLGYPHAQVAALDLPAGFTCPNADICKTFAHRKTGKLIRCGRVLCYAAKIEAMYPSVRKAHWNNYDMLLSRNNSFVDMAELIHVSLETTRIKVVRIHSSGDFFSDNYFKAWELVASWNPKIAFYGYTKVLNYVTCLKPDNFHLVYSFGSTDDTYAKLLRSAGAEIPTCYIKETPRQYDRLRLPVICGKGDEAGDFGYIMSDKSFALRIH